MHRTENFHCEEKGKTPSCQVNRRTASLDHRVQTQAWCQESEARSKERSEAWSDPQDWLLLSLAWSFAKTHNKLDMNFFIFKSSMKHGGVFPERIKHQWTTTLRNNSFYYPIRLINICFANINLTNSTTPNFCWLIHHWNRSKIMVTLWLYFFYTDDPDPARKCMVRIVHNNTNWIGRSWTLK